MISFQALMHAVQQSIHSAAQAVESAGIKHIDKFFDQIPRNKFTEIQENKKHLAEAQEALNNGDVDKANILLKALNTSAGVEDVVTPEDDSIYRPKMVAMAFPSQSQEGAGSTIVNVPLITLCPISSPRIKDVKFVTDLEVTSDDSDELYVAFRSPQKSSGEHSEFNDSTNTRIEISLVGHEPPEGLQKIIEGYEKALRAQIPG